jgi:Bacterial TSP3 repeat
MSGKASQIFGVILFIAVGVSAIFLGVKQYTQKINGPFAANAVAIAALKNQMQANVNSAAVDKTKDTDGDGLSDYDEVNIYHTSPYLKDTDSDGIPDGVEIKNGTDPNCPQGQTCVSQPSTNNQIPTDNEPDLNTLVNEQENINSMINEVQNIPVPVATPETNTPANEPTNAAAPPSAADIRAMLINAGLDEQSLEGVNDQDLIQLYNESLSETANTPANAPESANNNTP